MKLIVTLAAALSLYAPVAQAIYVPSEKPHATAGEEAAGLIDACISAFNELLSAYEGICDAASANAAAEKLPALHVNLQTAVDKVNALGETDEATQTLLMTRLLPMIFVNASRTETAFDRIRQNDYYGSEALRHFMEVELRPADPAA